MNSLPVFPVPRQIELTGQRFAIDDKVVVVAASSKPEDTEPARRVAFALADITRIGVPVVAGRAPAGRRPIFVARCGANPAAARRLNVAKTSPGPEGYALEVTRNQATVIGCDYAGALYGGSTLLELVRRRDLNFWIEGARVRDWPAKPVRGVHVFIPGKDQIPFFKRYLERFLLRYKFNTMILEVGGGARLKSHPEIPSGWARTVEEMYAHGEVFWKYGESCPLGPNGRFQDSTHRGVGYGAYIEAAELVELCAMARRLNINVIPEIQSLSHVYHLVCPRRDVAELPDALFPDAYCPSNEKSYRLIHDVIDEYLSIIGCNAVHIGHDEWRAGGLCPKCRRRHSGDLFAQDVIKLWRHLQARRCDLWMWGDHFVTKHNEKARSNSPTKPRSVWYNHPSTEGARDKVSRATRARPITITHWSWSMGEDTDEQLHDAGFRVVYGNFHGRMFHKDYPRRMAKPWILGAAISSWSAADEFELGKMHCASAAYGMNLIWNPDSLAPDVLQPGVLARLPEMKSRLLAHGLPSVTSPAEQRLKSIDIAKACNAPLRGKDWDLSALAGQSGRAGRVPWRIGSGKKACVVVRRPDDPSRTYPVEKTVPLNQRMEGLIFWHATTGPGGHTVHAGDQTHFPRESSDLVALYEIRFADGLTETVQCRFKETIDAWNASLEAGLYHAPHHLLAGTLPDGKPLVVCGQEWHNPRADIEILSIVMRGCRRRAYEKKAPTPATVLLGLSAVEKPRLKDYREA